MSKIYLTNDEEGAALWTKKPVWDDFANCFVSPLGCSHMFSIDANPVIDILAKKLKVKEGEIYEIVNGD